MTEVAVMAHITISLDTRLIKRPKGDLHGKSNVLIISGGSHELNERPRDHYQLRLSGVIGCCQQGVQSNHRIPQTQTLRISTSDRHNL